MQKTLLTAALIASFGSAALADGIQPVVSTSGILGTTVVSPEVLEVARQSSLSQDRLILIAAAAGITVLALLHLMDDESDGTN